MNPFNSFPLSLSSHFFLKRFPISIIYLTWEPENQRTREILARELYELLGHRGTVRQLHYSDFRKSSARSRTSASASALWYDSDNPLSHCSPWVELVKFIKFCKIFSIFFENIDYIICKIERNIFVIFQQFFFHFIWIYSIVEIFN